MNLSLTIDFEKPIHTMQGGIGANWHAIGPHAFWYEGLIGRRNRNSRGSVWGGNPPLAKERAWDDLLGHARWLGFNFFRLEFDLRMFYPVRGKFDFENPEMQTLHRQLDHCESVGAEVFLMHQHQDVAWNTHPGISPVQSSPRSIEDFAHGIVALVRHLRRDRKYSCIRWLCLSNEPGFPGCWWIGPDGKPASVMPAVHAVRRGLDKAGFPDLPISGPDWCNLRQESDDFDWKDGAVGCLDGHQYGKTADIAALELWVGRAREKGVPFFLSEFGSWTGDNPFEDAGDPHDPCWRSYGAQLTNAHRVIEGINAGVDGFNRWSFVNRGDLDGEFQLVRTWDKRRWEYLDRVTPEPVAYYGYGVISRFLPLRGRVAHVRRSGRAPAVSVTAVEGANGTRSIFMVNRGRSGSSLEIAIGEDTQKLHGYSVRESLLADESFTLRPEPVIIENGTVRCTVQPRTIQTLCTRKILPHEEGIIR